MKSRSYRLSFHERRRLLLAAAALVLTLGATTAPVTAQAGLPPLPPPPLSEETLCGLSLEQLLGTGLEGTDTIEDREAAQQRVEQLYQREVDRLRQQVIDEEGPLAFAVFALGQKSRGEERLDELLAENCLHQALVRARASREAEVRARAASIWDRFYGAAPLEGVFTLPPAEEEELPKPGPKGVIGKAGLGVNLPPPEMIRPGATITGTVTVDAPVEDASGQPVPSGAILSGLVVEIEGKKVPVNDEGRFVFEAPTGAQVIHFLLHGTQGAEDRLELKPLLDFKVEPTAAAPRIAPTSRRPQGEPSAEQPLPPGRMSAPPVAPARDPLIVTGEQPGGGLGLTTRAFLDDVELPLLWKTPEAAAFDLGPAPAGPHVLTLWEGGRPLATGAVSVVRLEAQSDRATLKSGEVANFTVRVSGLPPSLWPARGAAERTALAYDNQTPRVGKFVKRDDHFEVEIERERCTREPTSWRSVSVEPVPPRRKPITVPLDALRDTPLIWNPLVTNERIDEWKIALAYIDRQEYRGTTAGRFVVDVRVLLPPSATKPVPLEPLGPLVPDSTTEDPIATRPVAPPPAPLTVVQDRGQTYFVFPDGRRVERDWRGGEGYVRPDGTVVIDRGPRFGQTEYHPDGTIVYDDTANDRTTTTLPDGTRSVWDKRKGMETVTTPGGRTQEFWRPDYDTRIEKPFGAVSYAIRPDGTIAIEYDRRLGVEDTTIHPDGTRVTNYANDRRVEIRPDGTRVVLDKRASTETIECPDRPPRIFDVLQDGTRVERTGASCLETCRAGEQESCRTQCAASCGEVCVDATGCDCWTSCRDDCSADCDQGVPWECDQVCPEK